MYVVVVVMEMVVGEITHGLSSLEWIYLDRGAGSCLGLVLECEGGNMGTRSRFRAVEVVAEAERGWLRGGNGEVSLLLGQEKLVLRREMLGVAKRETERLGYRDPPLFGARSTESCVSISQACMFAFFC
ncbi:hypothetical protein BASA81_011159 [Batrachochytrium salamandrivorans]|nr:hypothetical protein BASA81_011159 [Batrachochytrium salamandrivorans]